jgi:glycosyltransferase involved in cell wall biosynthesis
LKLATSSNSQPLFPLAIPRPHDAGNLSRLPTTSPDGRELITVIVPVFNEVRTVRTVIERLLALRLPVAKQIIVVDDGSSDGTREALVAMESEGLPVMILYAERNGGKGSAIRRGLAAAHGSIVAIQDADLELDPQELVGLVGPLLNGDAGVVYGSRFLKGSSGVPLLTTVANGVLTRLTNLLYGAALTDMETCYKIMRTPIARSLNLTAERFDIEPQITARLLRGGHRIHELPVRFEPRGRAKGKKIGWRDGIRAIQVLVAERLRRR